MGVLLLRERSKARGSPVWGYIEQVGGAAGVCVCVCGVCVGGGGGGGGILLERGGQGRAARRSVG